jgi:acyl-CoA thioester hydrolase
VSEPRVEQGREQRGQWREGWFVVPHDVIFRDIDAYGHVNNAVFITYFEIARTLLWFEVSGGGRGARDIGFIVARVECDFRKQLAMEPIEICVRFGEARTTSFDTHYEIRTARGEIAATGKVVVVLFDWESRSKVVMADELRRRIAECSMVAS